ncbi:response regulator [Rhodoplanes roseus]|uniref:Response regulatory domain-containing protein n=1 Tax=Rhodoplanes roseus TaxID=29409 RepID=A0A327L2Z7_9BRAD|nr:response regulator [Rhodoplanes roseus]RAI45470.1 hypothetical protein CH341_03935 [Rhodoplanes roseus]
MARILIIDDDELIRVSLGLLLESAGHTIVTAATGRAALASLAATEVDLVVCDVFMPDMDGFETLRALKQRAPALPVVVISGDRAPRPDQPSPDFLKMAVDLGATAGLRKPFEPKAVKALVARCLEDAKRTGG